MTDPVNSEDRSKYRPKNLNGGRPEMFPDSNTIKRSVTLPAEIWQYIQTLDPSISRAIFEMTIQHQANNS